MPAGIPSSEFPIEDRPEIREAFADSMGNSFFDGHTLRLDFCAVRFDPVKPPSKVTGKRFVTARLVLSPEGTLELINTLHGYAEIMKKTGLIKEVPKTPATSGQPH